MASIVVKGIDRDGESRSMLYEDVEPRVLAEYLHQQGWKWARLTIENEVVGGVYFNVKKMTYGWWGINV